MPRFTNPIPVILIFLLSLTSCFGEAKTASLDISSGVSTDMIESLAPSSVSFITFGDWGSGSDIQRQVASQIGTYCQSFSCDFLLTLGDNFYPSGVSSTTDPLWQTTYQDVYGNMGLDFYVADGNHDDGGNIAAEIEYSNIDPKWHFPARDYTFSYPLNAATPTVQFFMVDADFPISQTAINKLKTELSQSKAIWKVLVRHYPFLTNLPVSERDDDELEKTMCGNVDLVLSGHVHSFEILRGHTKNCWIEQIIVGTGGADVEEQSESKDDGRLVTAASVNGFGWIQANEKSFIFRMIALDGSVIYSSQWTRKPIPSTPGNPYP